jgi:hypothetical protein
MKQQASACFTANAVGSLFSMSVFLVFVAAEPNGAAADVVYFEASEGFLAGQYQAYEPNPPSAQYGRSFSRSSPSIGIGIRLTPWIAVEEEYDDDGSYTFDNVYAYPTGPITEFERNQIDERLRSATTRVAITVALPKRWSLNFSPGVEYQFLRQTVDYLQWYTVPFSLAQVVPAPSSQTYKFWRPEFDARLSHALPAHLSVFVGYRFFESPGKELSRISGGVSALW